MKTAAPYARIAITLPQDDLAAAVRWAAQQGRSRSWFVAEAIRRYVKELESPRFDPLGPSRNLQLQRYRALSATQRIVEADGVASLGTTIPIIEVPLRFTSYDEFAAWRRTHANG